MKYYKFENGFGEQPNDIIPDNAVEISAEEYLDLKTKFDEYWELIRVYVSDIIDGNITLEDIPEEYREDVQANLPEPTPELYTLDEASEIIAKEVSGYVG